MLADAVRIKLGEYLDKIGSFLAKTHINPNVFSFLALIVATLGSLLFHYRHYYAAFIVIVVACLWDTFDGAVARSQKKVTRFGYYIEGIIDKWVEVIIYLGFAISGYPLESFLVITATLMLSFAKPRAAMVVPIKEHDWPAIGERFERLTLLGIGLFIFLFFPKIRIAHYELSTLSIVFSILFIITMIGGIQRVLYAKKIIEQGGLEKMNVVTRDVFSNK